MSRRDRRRLPRTCTRWARVFGGPVQTDSGWPKKVSRRVQEASAILRAGGGAQGDCFGLSLLAGVLAAAGFAGRGVGRRLACDRQVQDTRVAFR